MSDDNDYENGCRVSSSEETGESTPSERSSSSSDDPSSNGGVPAAIDVASNSKAPFSTRKSKPKFKKPEGMPRRPLSAYNYFYKAERVRWLEEQRNRPEQPDENHPEQNGFIRLGQAISARWRNLSLEDKKPYEELAKSDLERYRKEMLEYNMLLVRPEVGYTTCTDRSSSLSDGFESPTSSENGQIQHALPTPFDPKQQQQNQPSEMAQTQPRSESQSAFFQCHLSPFIEQLLTKMFTQNVSQAQLDQIKGLLQQLERVLILMMRLHGREQASGPPAALQPPAQSLDASQLAGIDPEVLVATVDQLQQQQPSVSPLPVQQFPVPQQPQISPQARVVAGTLASIVEQLRQQQNAQG